MSAQLIESATRFLSDFRSRRILVLGDAILDEYVRGDCTRISPEAPVPVLKVSGLRRVLGGAANTAANIVSLGGKATLIALVGDDEGGLALKQCAADAGVDLKGVASDVPTLRKIRVIGHQQQIVRLDYEEVVPLPSVTEARILDLFNAALSACDIVVISDYAKGFVTAPLVQTVIKRAHQAGRQVIIDPRPQHGDCYVGCDYITPNWREARALLRLPDAEPSREAVSELAGFLAHALETNVVLTLGPHGIAFRDRTGSQEFAVPTFAKEVFDVSGAGDTVVAALSLALASGANHRTAVEIANRAASVVVGKFGTATVTAEEILEEQARPRLVPRDALASLAAMLRSEGKRVVTINGSFDVLHAGHLHILNEARAQGDVLIVGLNSDSSIRAYKGSARPIMPEQRRVEMLLALRMVDYVHVFDESDPISFLSEVKPDVHVNGSEYGEDCIESNTVRGAGGKIHIVEKIPGLSTTNMVEALRATAVTN